MTIDSFHCCERFREHFKNLHQVFMYITDQCNLRCIQCIYKPNIIFNNEREISPPVAIALLATFKELGASKLTLLGGEPTLYGADDDGKSLFEVIQAARDLGFEYLRLDTNGQFPVNLLHQPAFRLLDEIAFSIDGYTPEMNDLIRGKDTFINSILRIGQAKALGYKVTVTCCIHSELTKRSITGESGIESMIRFAESIGVDQINFHDLFKVGVPMDTWTGDLDPEIEEWVSAFNATRLKMAAGMYRISIRLPQCFIKQEEFATNPEYYGYCPAKLGERVMVHPGGVIRICSNLISSPFYIANYDDKQISWLNTGSNEILEHKPDQFTPCTNRSRNKRYGEYVPLCFSFKPDQDEIIFKEKLMWELRKNPNEANNRTEKLA